VADLPPLASRRMVHRTPVVGALQPVRTSVLHRIAPGLDLDPTGARARTRTTHTHTHTHSYIHTYVRTYVRTNARTHARADSSERGGSSRATMSESRLSRLITTHR